MDDDLEKADEELSKGSSAFHKVRFMQKAFSHALNSSTIYYLRLSEYPFDSLAMDVDL
jgi:hypothetical protein